jgi:peptidoglycan/xylan/chitin deacetylase (PgdA/CDA1 family)
VDTKAGNGLAGLSPSKRNRPTVTDPTSPSEGNSETGSDSTATTPNTAPVIVRPRRGLRWLRWLLLPPCLVALAGAAIFGSLYVPHDMPYDRQRDPWLTPLKSYHEWRLDGLRKTPLAIEEWLKTGNADAKRQKLIAITFDDGPYPLYTPLLLAVLRHYHVHATFFVVGLHVEQYPELTREIFRDGHELANHTYTHRREKQFKPGELREELLKTEQAIAHATGFTPSLFRPAGGFMSKAGVTTIRDLGYTMCNYTVNPGDWWQYDPEKLIKSVFKGRSREGVTLFHSGAFGIIRTLPAYISEMKAKGFQFVTVSELGAAVNDPVPPNPRASQYHEESEDKLPEIPPDAPDGTIRDS